MKISYVTLHGVGEWVEFTPANSDTLTLTLEPRYDGTVVLNGTLYKLRHGEVTLDVRSIPDGEHYPRLECEGGVFPLGGFVKLGRSITPIENDRDALRRLIKGYRQLEKRLAEAEKAITELNAICRGHSIFNYERKEK